MSNERQERFSSKQLIILFVLGAGACLVMYLGFRLVLKPPEPLPPTINPLVPSITTSLDWTDPTHPIINGKTNLPDGTFLILSVREETGLFSGQDKVSVLGGRFRSGPWGPDAGLAYGSYELEVVMPVSSAQPENVRKVIGYDGENLVGNNVFHEGMGVIVKAGTSFDFLQPTPIVSNCYGPDIGKTKVNAIQKYEFTLHRAYKTNRAFGDTPFLDNDYEPAFVIVEFTYKNLGDSQDFIIVDHQFMLHVIDDFALDDINTSILYTGRAIYATEAWEVGFFIDEEVLPGGSFRGQVAFEVPEISHNYILTTGSISCGIKDSKVYCNDALENGAAFQFRD